MMQHNMYWTFMWQFQCLIRAGIYYFFLLINVFDCIAKGIFFSWSRKDEGRHSYRPLLLFQYSLRYTNFYLVQRYNTRMKLWVDSYFHHQEPRTVDIDAVNFWKYKINKYIWRTIYFVQVWNFGQHTN